MNPSALEDLGTVVRLAAEGSDWKRDQGETLCAWAQRRLRSPEYVQREAEVRLNDNGTLDEVVTKDGDQLEQMDFNHWFLQIGDVAVWLWAKGKITATYERRPSSTCE